MSVIPLFPPQANTGEPWDEDDTNDLLDMLRQKMGVHVIAEFLRRTPPEIRHRIRQLGCDYLLDRAARPERRGA